jgi:GntR family transcriptional regulator
MNNALRGADATVLADDARPLHAQLRQAILDAIDAGEWLPESRIASENELCARFGVSRTTARRAIADLVHEGVLVTVGGKGTFVADRPLRQELRPLVGFQDDLRAQNIEVRSVLLDLSRVEAPPELAADLEIGDFSPVVRLRRLRLADDQPLAVQTSFLPEHLCPGLLRLDFEGRSLYRTLRDDYGLNLVDGSTVIQAALAEPEEAELLGLPPLGPVLRTIQTTRLAGGRVIERCEASFHGDRFRLTAGGNTGGGLDPRFAEQTGMGKD